MASNKLEYDSTLGGHVVLPNYIPTYRYAADSMQEIKHLLHEIRHPTSTKLVFQTLPKHMRRRAMSHHPKRLPRKYRAIHRSQMSKAGKPQQTKRPSRKYRRKPSNLLKEYIRRQRKHTWLETHIWHAKRFHMITRWGYRLPYASCDKTYRACYRATAEHCLLQDISFYACIQLEGTLAEISAGFVKLSSSCCSLSVFAKTYVSGRREGSIELFRAEQYPEGALGKVTFLWKPLEDGEECVDGKRLLWLWVHPSGYQALLEEIIKVFKLISMKSIKVPIEEKQPEVDNQSEVQELTEDSEINEKKTEKKKKDSPNAKSKPAPKKLQRRLQFMTRTFAYERIKRYTNSTQTLQLTELKDTMNRFRLTGPLAHSVLAHAFKVASVKVDPENPNKTTQAAATNWFQTQLAQHGSYQTHHQMQAEFWQECLNLSTPAELLPNLVVALNILDPRTNRPKKRTKATPTCEQPSARLQNWFCQPPIELPQSCLWQAEVRDRVCADMMTTQAYCEKRAKHVVVPGEPCSFEHDMQPVPVLLVQRPGSQLPRYKRLGYGAGWDVIVPAGYGMSVWLALIMWGARPGGLREFGSIARELGTEEFLPDTVGGQQHFAERHDELRSKYFRLPPNKRCNYRKFAIVSPFRVPFTELIRDWQLQQADAQAVELTNKVKSSYFILRDRRLLRQLEACIARKKSCDFPATLPSNCLIQLHILMKSRGNSNDFSLICLPTHTDFKRNLKLLKRENHEPVLTEPLKADPNEKLRKLLRTEHKKLLKRMRARRIREKRKKQETGQVKVHIPPAGTAQLVAEQFKRMCALWLPEADAAKPQSVRQQGIRQVFGYITQSSFSYVEARVCGIGYVTVEGLKKLLDLCHAARLKQPMCLVRGTDSRHYRFASFKLNTEV